MYSDQDARSVVDGWRTELKPGQERAYRELHSRIPDDVALALRESGVISWRIWQDGLVLYHAIETEGGLEDMGQRMSARGPVDREWDELVGELVSSAAGTQYLLTPVWAMTPDGQIGGALASS